MDSPRVSIAHLLALDVPLTWTDAVAVAQAAAIVSDSQSLLADAPTVVRSDVCFITAEGDVELPVADAAAPGDGVLALLREMLAGRDAPPDVLRVARGDDAGSVTALLTQFEIGDGRAAIAALARAARGRDEAPKLASERMLSPRPLAMPPPGAQAPRAPAPLVAEPRASAAGRTLTSVPVPARLAPVVPARPLVPLSLPAQVRVAEWLREQVRWRPAVAATAGAGLVVAGLWFAWPAPAVVPLPLASRALPGGLTGFAGPALAVSTDAATAAVAVVTTLVTDPAAPPADTGIGAPADGSAPDVSDDGALLQTPSPAVDATSNAPASDARSTAAASQAASPGLSGTPDGVRLEAGTSDRSTREGGGGAEDGRLYSADDLDVVPPVLRTAALPTLFRPPDDPVPANWPHLHVVVDRSGAVELVRLLADTPKPGESLYRQQMLLAAAKAWRFTPASRNGRPVRYTIRIPLEP